MIKQSLDKHGAKVRDVCVDRETGAVVVALEYGWQRDGEHWVELHELDTQDRVDSAMGRVSECSCMECRIGSKK